MQPLIPTFLQMAPGAPALLRKWIVKWLTRMACANLPQPVCSWRYNRGGRRSLLDNLQQQQQQQQQQQDQKYNDNDDTIAEEEEEEEELWWVPAKEQEDIMGHLVSLSLQDSATAVRWSAAKGIGRLTERLPQLCADDVVDALLGQTQRNPEKDTTWHGTCLALGELARRGLLLPHRLPQVIPFLLKAIQVK